MSFPLETLPSPCYVVDESKLIRNLERFKLIKQRTGCRVMLALKAFSMSHSFPLLKTYLDGCSASALNEAKLGSELFGKEIHTYSPGYDMYEIDEIIQISDHVTFNSLSQWQRFKSKFEGKSAKAGIRINPEQSEVDINLYNPCAPYSRFGITKEECDFEQLEGISGVLVHNLCGKHVDSLERTLDKLKTNFAPLLHKIEWLNLGGGHAVNHEGYDLDTLCDLICDLQNTYNLQVILEPGEAIALNAGYLVSTVVDIMKNKKDIAILDTSATAHMPDVLEMPYRPDIQNSGEPGEFTNNYRLGGVTCLSGDIIGDYSFKKPLEIGDKLVFDDMAQYTMVKNTQFNGIRLPAIAWLDKHNKLSVIKTFGYDTFKHHA